MPIYVYPEMPLIAAIWYDHPESLPTTQPDGVVDVSLSPKRPEDFFRSTAAPGPAEATHIIRTAPNVLLADNFWPRKPGPLFPCSLFECPESSGHFYATVWAHHVGAGFSNHHLRVYVTRWIFVNTDIYPLFRGWI